MSYFVQRVPYKTASSGRRPILSELTSLPTMLEDVLAAISLESAPSNPRVLPPTSYEIFARNPTKDLIGRIPADVWITIFEAGNYSRGQLAYLSLVCKWFRMLCVPRMYKRIVLEQEYIDREREEEITQLLELGVTPETSLDRFRGLADKSSEPLLPVIRTLEFRQSFLTRKGWWRYRLPVLSRATRHFLRRNWQDVFHVVAPLISSMQSLQRISLAYLHLSDDLVQGLNKLPYMNNVELIKCTFDSKCLPDVQDLTIIAPLRHSQWPTHPLDRVISLVIHPFIDDSHSFPTQLTSLSFSLIDIQGEVAAANAKRALSSLNQLEHLNTLGGIYYKRQARFECHEAPHGCPSEILFEAPLPKLRSVEGLCYTVREALKERELHSVAIWCSTYRRDQHDGLAGVITGPSVTNCSIRKFFYGNFQNAVDTRGLPDLMPKLEHLTLHGRYNGVSEFMPRLVDILPQLPNLRGLDIRMRLQDLVFLNSVPKPPRQFTKPEKQALIVVTKLAPLAPQMEMITISMNQHAQMVLYPLGSGRDWDMVLVGFDWKRGEYVPDPWAGGLVAGRTYTIRRKTS